MDRSLRCEVTGWLVEGVGYLDGDRCTQPATHRYRSLFNPDPWKYRCAKDARSLDRRFVLVEEIGDMDANDSVAQEPDVLLAASVDSAVRVPEMSANPLPVKCVEHEKVLPHYRCEESERWLDVQERAS